MITETPTDIVPPEIFQNIESLHGEVEKLQRELTQALEVWQATLSDEKKKFDDLLEHKELAWQEQGSQWARQSQAYEERMTDLKFELESRLKQSEQNASRALAELDDAWQRDKLEWGPAAQSQWPAERREFETKVQFLEQQIAEMESAHALEREALQARIRELENRPEPAASRSDELVSACVEALDYQISVLYDLVYHFEQPQPVS